MKLYFFIFFFLRGHILCGEFVWLTDIHMDEKKSLEVYEFLQTLSEECKDADGIFITGDIGEWGTCIPFIEVVEKTNNTPIYFVLGNHDFYGQSIEHFQEKVVLYFKSNPIVHYCIVNKIFTHRDASF